MEADRVGMPPDTILLTKLLTLALLVASTIEYAELIRRRAIRRFDAQERNALAQHGLHGLVRVFLAELPSTDHATAKVQA